MSISATVIADSINPQGKRLTTLQLRYPKFIHGELMTHRVFSRNASSTRAIPTAKMIDDLLRDPAMPVFWGTNKPGMQAGAEIEGEARENAETEWKAAMSAAITSAQNLMHYGLHKQIASRILEPWYCINTLVSATEWGNFFTLRTHIDAQPEMRALAREMLLAMAESTPKKLLPGKWHLPYINWDENDHASDVRQGRIVCGTALPDHPWMLRDLLIKQSVARCARVSYLTHEAKVPTIDEDLALYNRLVGAQPIHASPAEHQATPDEMWPVPESTADDWAHPERHGNFVGWCQYRKSLPGEAGPQA